MISFAEVISSIDRAFPLFSYGEGHIDEFLDRYSFDRDGVQRRWEMFDRLSKNEMEFLRTEFPTMGECRRSACCELQMYPLRDKIERIDREYECYRSIVERHSPLLLDL